MMYRVCKSFEIESGHMLSKHPGVCRFPHGHSRTIEVVLTSESLDSCDMVCDFKVLKLAVRGYLERLDHAMAVNSNDPMLANLGTARERVVVFQNADPTTEVMAREIYKFIEAELRAGKSYKDDRGDSYSFPHGVLVQRVRVSETSSSWAEYGL